MFVEWVELGTKCVFQSIYRFLLYMVSQTCSNLQLEISKSTCVVGGNVDAVGAERVCKI